MSSDKYDEYKKYHPCLIHKLHSSLHHLKQLDSSSKPLESEPWNHVLQKVNMHMDGFFYCTGSALDILARELLSLYNIGMPPFVYFKTAVNLISRQDCNDPMLRILDIAWKDEFTLYRNKTTHELLIANQMTVTAKIDGNRMIKTYGFPLPDDPNSNNLTYRKNTDVVVYCENTFRRLLSLINCVYRQVLQKIDDNGFPLR